MRQFIIQFLTVFLPTILFAQADRSDWSEMSLKGKIKSLTEIQYKTAIVSEKFQKQYKGQWTKYSFNEKGFLIEKTDLEPNGYLYRKLIYEYDSLGKLIAMKSFGRDDSLSATHTFKYDIAGNQVQDNIENVKSVDKGHNAKYLYKYDEKRNCIEMSGFNSKGIYFTKYTYKYDNKGNKIEEIWFEANGDTIHVNSYKYNDKGKKIEEYCKFTSNGDGENKTLYKYDSKGNLIEESWGGTEGNVIDQVTYTLDINYNWVKKIVTEGKNPSSITEREIEYYRFNYTKKKTLVGVYSGTRQIDYTKNCIQSCTFNYSLTLREDSTGKLISLPSCKFNKDCVAKNFPKDNTSECKWATKKDTLILTCNNNVPEAIFGGTLTYKFLIKTDTLKSIICCNDDPTLPPIIFIKKKK